MRHLRLNAIIAILAGLIVLGIPTYTYSMAMKLKSPPKGITLKSKSIMLYSIKESKKYACESLEIFDIWGLKFNVGAATNFQGDSLGVASIAYDLKGLPPLLENFPPSTSITWTIEQINKIPLVELGVGAYVAHPFENINMDKVDYGLALTVIQLSW